MTGFLKVVRRFGSRVARRIGTLDRAPRSYLRRFAGEINVKFKKSAPIPARWRAMAIQINTPVTW
jgi:hypothetical protein